MARGSPYREKDKDGNTRHAKKYKKRRYWKALRIGAVFGIIETVALVLWIKSEDFEPEAAHFLRNIATCLFLAGAAYLAHKFTGGRFKKWIIGSIWFVWGFFCIVVFLSESKSPKPDLTVSLQLGNSPTATIILTNEYLHFASAVNFITNFPDGFSFFNGVPSAFILAPIHSGESNVVFRFITKNNSPFLEANSLEFVAVFPPDWKLGMDSEKWHEATANVGELGHELELTNFQILLLQYPFILYSGDHLYLPPITNFNPEVWHGPSTRIESFRFAIKSPGFTQVLTANICFSQGPSNWVKPFLFPAGIDTNRVLRPLISSNELKRELEDFSK